MQFKMRKCVLQFNMISVEQSTSHKASHHTPVLMWPLPLSIGTMLLQAYCSISLVTVM